MRGIPDSGREWGIDWAIYQGLYWTYQKIWKSVWTRINNQQRWLRDPQANLDSDQDHERNTKETYWEEYSKEKGWEAIE